MARAKRKEEESTSSNVAQMGGNIEGLYDDIKGSYDKIEQWKKDRQEINAKIKAERERINAKGIVKIAFDAAMSYVNMDPERQEGYDTAYIIAREALGKPVKGAQADLFAADEKEVDQENDEG
jgi:hypothetical protein